MTPKFQNKLIGLQRYILWHQPIGSKNYYVSEFPKSGGTWFCQMLSNLTGTPFPRNRFVNKLPCILHSHLIPNNRIHKPIIILRDGRDIMVSAYHHFILPNDHCPKHEQKKWQALLKASEPLKIRLNLVKFINVFHENYKVGGASVTWQSHVLNCHKYDPIIIKYEDLLTNPAHELLRIAAYLGTSYSEESIGQTIEKFSFERLKQKNPESNFLRKGITGDWKNYFTYQSGELFESLGGEALRRCSYTSDNSWYHDLPR